MIDESILDKIIPIPTEEEAMLKVRKQLEGEGFPVNNYNKGGIMYGFLRMVVVCHIQLLKLARTIVNQCFMKHATGDWADIKAADYGKVRKEAQKTQGYITVTRENYTNAVEIRKGHGFKTLPDTNGHEKKYYCMENVAIPAGQQTGKVLVEAEEKGSEYNVSPGRIVVSMIYIDGNAVVTNDEDWLYKEASDRESDTELNTRCLNSYSELAARTTAAKLKSIAEEVEGVINVTIHDQHPRGQGTTDIIVTGAAGEATAELLREVEEHTAWLKGNYDDYLYKSSTVEYQNITMTIFLAENASIDGVKNLAEEKIHAMINVNRKELNVLYLDDIRYILKTYVPEYRTSKITEPAADVEYGAGVVILPGILSISVEHV